MIKATLEQLQELNKGSMGEALGIEFTEVTTHSISARMPVDYRTIQPMGILHGGASVVMAETLGSVAAHFSVDQQKYACVGLEINANHIKSVLSGQWVYAKATVLHQGKSTQVWEVRLQNQQEQLVCISRITVAVVEKKEKTT